MNIPARQILYRKKIGKTSDGDTVLGIGTIGGLHLVVAAKEGGEFETLGVGSHLGIAKFIARKQSKISYDTLEKSEDMPFEHFKDLLPFYEDLTASLRESQGL